MRALSTRTRSRTLCVCAISLLGCLLSSCALDCTTRPPLPPRVVDTGCDWIPVLSASANDTPDTKREVIAYESARQQKCSSLRDAHSRTSREAN